MIDLLNKSIKVSSVDDLCFYFPGFKVCKTLSIMDCGEKIIYTGPLNKKALEILSTCTYIATQGLSQYDLSNRKKKIEFIFSKYDREVPASIMNSIDLYDDNEFDYCCKVYWTCARWPYKPESEESIYSLYQESVNSINDFIKKYYECLREYKIPILEQSFFTFILRSKSVDEQNVSPQYKRLLKVFNNTAGVRVRPSMNAYIESPIKNKELRFLEFIFNLRGN